MDKVLRRLEIPITDDMTIEEKFKLVDKFVYDRRFYVYVYVDLTKTCKDRAFFEYGVDVEKMEGYLFPFEPFYIGKGQKRRMYDHIKERNLLNDPNIEKVNKIRELLKIDKLGIFYIEQMMTEKEAFDLEKQLIKWIGRKDENKGPLLNRTDGGDGETGYHHTEEHKQHMSKLMKSNWEDENNPVIVGMRKFQEDNKEEISEKISKMLSGKKKSKEHCENLSKSKRGKPSPNKGKPLSKNQKDKMSKTMKGRYKGKDNPNYGNRWSIEQKQKMRDEKKNKIHIYNQELDIVKEHPKDEPIPEGWRRGQRPKTAEQRRQNSEYRKGKIFIYNKELDKQKYHDKNLPIPEGYVKGRRKDYK